MAKKKNNDYFELMKQQTAYCVEASNLLQEILSSFNPDSISIYRQQMHEIEHKADTIHNEILDKLSTEFLTPIDQEDILQLVQIIDDITDELDESILDIYMYHLNAIPEGTVELSKIVNKCVKALDDVMSELKNFKKREPLRSLLMRVTEIETEADGIYTEAVHNLFGSNVDMKTLLAAKEIFESLESCCDLCDHAADVVAQVIIKNT